MFQLCAAADRGVLENIVHLAQQVVPELNITLAEAHKHGDVYVVRIPASTTEIAVNLSQMREIVKAIGLGDAAAAQAACSQHLGRAAREANSLLDAREGEARID